MENPVGFDFETVCVSWKVRETSARRQQNAKIEVSLKEDFQRFSGKKKEKILTARQKNWSLPGVHIQDIM